MDAECIHDICVILELDIEAHFLIPSVHVYHAILIRYRLLEEAAVFMQHMPHGRRRPAKGNFLQPWNCA